MNRCMNPIYHDMRTFRKESVFTQKDIADLLGTKDVSQISRHETNPIHPQVEMGLLYEILFKAPFSEFFPRQKELLKKRLRVRIPNIIDELKCLDMNDIVNKKIGCLQSILSDLDNPSQNV
jgi:transcriptional regulator with XRE-family HTH domain